MLSEGEIFIAPYVAGDEDHPCILLTPWEEGGEVVIVNLTAYVNIFSPDVDMPANTSLSVRFTTSKRTTIHYAYAKRLACHQLEIDMSHPGAKRFGTCDATWLELIRTQLFASLDTPPEVLDFCAEFDWGY